MLTSMQGLLHFKEIPAVLDSKGGVLPKEKNVKTIFMYVKNFLRGAYHLFSIFVNILTK